MAERTIVVKALTRVEGEGGLYVRTRGDAVEEVRLEIFEPPRLFESLLRGRPLEDTPDITARICGICPVAYQMSSVHALEAALNVEVSPEIRRLRRLLYCGEWIESHALHVYLLNGPDFLGFESGLEMAQQFPDEVNRGLRMKKHGNQLLEALGGRAIHPVNVAVGGFYRAPPRKQLKALIPDFEWGLAAAVETTRWVAGLDFPDFQQPYQLVSLTHPTEYPMNAGAIAIRDVGTSSGGDLEGDQATADGIANGGFDEVVPVERFDDEFEESHVAHSTALHARRVADGKHYLVGPLARVGLNLAQLAPTARRLAEETGIAWPSCNPFQAIVARGVELIHAFEEGLQILRDYRSPQPARADYTYRAGTGCAATEAPRGLLFHRYEVDDEGKIVAARIVPPTSQNQAQIESDLRALIPDLLTEQDSVFSRSCENLVRCYDPCISCSTHFLRVQLERQ